MDTTTITMGTATAMADGAIPLPFDELGDTDSTDIASLHRLMSWLSPSFPVGAFSYSHGLEWAVEDGTVKNRADLDRWVSDVLLSGAGRSDAILLGHSWRAARTGDQDGLRMIAELAAAFQPSAERRLESMAQGRAFLMTALATWPMPALESLALAIQAEDGTAYAVAVGVVAAAHGVPRRPAIAAYLHAFAANIVSAGLRAIPLGQTDGQRIVAALGSTVEAVIDAVEGAALDDLGGAVFRADIASMKHETQYTRLFRS